MQILIFVCFIGLVMMDDIFGQAQLNIMKMAQGGEASFMNYYYILIRVRDKYEGDDTVT